MSRQTSERRSIVRRKTNETEVELNLVIEGSGNFDVDTGVGFLDHMLTLFARHGFFDLTVRARGDLKVDQHHTVEDVGICLGDALSEALGERKGIERYGNAFVPMDEALGSACVDLSGRPFLVYNVNLPAEKVGEFDVGLAEEFFRAFTSHGKFALHVNVPYGSNPHHIIEAVFKAVGRALDEATRASGRVKGVPSTKGVL